MSFFFGLHGAANDGTGAYLQCSLDLDSEGDEHAEEEYKRPIHANTFIVSTFKSAKCGNSAWYYDFAAAKHVDMMEVPNDGVDLNQLN